MSDILDLPDAEEEEQVVEPEPLMPEPEPEDALTAFNREWNAKLEAKRAAEVRAEETARKEAKEEFENWTAQKETRLNARKEVNRTEEQVFLEQQESDLESANVWDRVTKLIDLQADFSSESGNSDVSRMRKLFLQLKNEPLETTRNVKVEA